MVPKVEKVVALDDHALLVEFNNADKRLYDVTSLLEREMFAPLKNGVLFRSVQIEKGGYAVYWNADIDLSEYEIWTHGIPLEP